MRVKMCHMSNNNTSQHAAQKPSGHWRTPVSLLALGTFAMGTDSFVVAGILPQLAHGMSVSISTAGQVVTTFAVTYAVLAPLLAALTHRVPRRALIAISLVIFIAGNALAALAPTFAVLLLARIITAIGGALYTPTANASAIALAGDSRRGTALSIVLGGLATGTVFGVPLGTAIGQWLGWRASMAFIALVALIALIALAVTLPALPTPPSQPLRQRFAVLANGRVLLVVLLSALSTGSGITFYTYIAEALKATANITGAGLTVALIVWGVGGALGAFSSGPLTDRIGPFMTLGIAIIATGGGVFIIGLMNTLWAAIPFLLIGGAASWALNTPTNHMVAGIVPDRAQIGISFNSSGTYLGQAIGAGFGGLLLNMGIDPSGLCNAAAIGSAFTLLVFLLVRPVLRSTSN